MEVRRFGGIESVARALLSFCEEGLVIACMKIDFIYLSQSSSLQSLPRVEDQPFSKPSLNFLTPAPNNVTPRPFGSTIPASVAHIYLSGMRRQLGGSYSLPLGRDLPHRGTAASLGSPPVPLLHVLRAP